MGRGRELAIPWGVCVDEFNAAAVAARRMPDVANTSNRYSVTYRLTSAASAPPTSRPRAAGGSSGAAERRHRAGTVGPHGRRPARHGPSDRAWGFATGAERAVLHTTDPSRLVNDHAVNRLALGV